MRQVWRCQSPASPIGWSGQPGWLVRRGASFLHESPPFAARTTLLAAKPSPFVKEKGGAPDQPTRDNFTFTSDHQPAMAISVSFVGHGLHLFQVIPAMYSLALNPNIGAAQTAESISIKVNFEAPSKIESHTVSEPSFFLLRWPPLLGMELRGPCRRLFCSVSPMSV